MLDTIENFHILKCPFCIENKFYLYQFVLNKYDIKYLTIYKTPNFIVIPDIAPLVEGHMLIVSAKHYLCFGSLLDKYYTEFQQVKKYISYKLTRTYTEPIFFEHGPAFPKRAGCCIDHAHIHCLPVNIDISRTLNKNFEEQKISSILELCNYYKRKISYLFYETRFGSLYAYPLSDKNNILPSQYLRQVVKSDLNLDNWDWKQIVTENNLNSRNKVIILNSIKKLQNNL